MVDIDKQSVKVLIVELDKNPLVKNIPKNLDSFRNIIGNSSIEMEVYKRAILVYDVQGLAKNLPITRYVDTEDGKKAIRGTFFIMGNDSYYGDYQDLTKEEIGEFINEFSIEREEELEM